MPDCDEPTMIHRGFTERSVVKEEEKLRRGETIYELVIDDCGTKGRNNAASSEVRTSAIIGSAAANTIPSLSYYVSNNVII